jgi:L-arabinose isomerase
MLPDLSQFQVWFVTGSQNLYGPTVLKQVDEHSTEIAAAFNQDEQIPVSVVFKPVLKSATEIFEICQAANTDKSCIGLILWMHTFSPAKMWINGLKILHKPFVHLHTQFNRDIPWKTIDMHFMNLNQSAHGDREFGHICSRMRINRKVITGHWEEKEVRQELGIWVRAACAWADWQGGRFVRFGDNMRDVAVTEGDKVEAELKFGYSVNTHGVGDLVAEINQVKESDIDNLCQEYEQQYQLVDALKNERNDSLRVAAKIELGLRQFLEKGNYKGFTDTFEVRIFVDLFFSIKNKNIYDLGSSWSSTITRYCCSTIDERWIWIRW